jgi:thiol-disulfide isomerase/thioredoxin
VVLVACALLLISACGGGGSSNQALDATFSRFDGSQASFRDYRGKPVVVNFFSSTCVPCQSEMPAFEQIHRTAGDAVTFLGMDVQDTVASGNAFVETVGVTWDLGRDPDASILQSLGGVGLPTTVVLDRDGKIVYKHLGQLDAGELSKQLHDHGFTS